MFTLLDITDYGIEMIKRFQDKKKKKKKRKNGKTHL